MHTWFTAKRIWQFAALFTSLAATAGVFLLPIFTVAAQQGAGQTEVRATAFEVAGPSVLVVVAIPLALCALPLFFHRRAWVITGYVSAVGMILYTVTGIMSIGLLFLPAAVLAVIGAFVQPPQSRF